MHAVKSTQRWQQLFQSLGTVEWSAAVLEHVLVPPDTLAAALGPWGQAAECWGQAGSGCSTSLAMLQLPPPARRVVGEEGGLHGDALCALPLDEQALLPLTLRLILLLAVLHGQVYRFCTLEGTWLLKENSTLPWRNLSECEPSDQVRVFPIFSLSCCCCLGQSRREEKK